MASLRDARILVTGASGFIGSHLARRLLNDGAEVHVVTSGVSRVFPTRLLDVRDSVTLHEANLMDATALRAVLGRARPSHVFHLGAYTHVGKSWDRVDECVQTNVQGTVNLLRTAVEAGCERVIFTGTSEIYGPIDSPFAEDAQVQPASPYAVSKYAAESYCRMFYESRGWPIVMLRPFNAYGPGQSPDRVIPEIIVRALRRKSLLMTEGRQTREFNFVEDLVDGFVRSAVTPGIEGQLFNLGCGEDIAMRDLATLILDLMGNPIAAQFGALPERPGEIMRMASDSTKARTALNWEPRVTLRAGLERTISWYQEQLEGASSPFEL